jgi:hypothetical protein
VKSVSSWECARDDRYFRNELEDYDFPAQAIEESLSRLPETLRNA